MAVRQKRVSLMELYRGMSLTADQRKIRKKPVLCIHTPHLGLGLSSPMNVYIASATMDVKGAILKSKWRGEVVRS